MVKQQSLDGFDLKLTPMSITVSSVAFAKSPIASKPLILQLKSQLSLLKPMETINLKEEVRNIIDKLPENFTWSDLMYAIYIRQAIKSEAIQVKGIKQGKNIQLSEDFNIPDGSEVLIEVQEVSPVNHEEKLKRMKEFLAALSDEDREEWKKIGEFLESDRTTNRKSSVMPPKKQRRPPLFGCDREVITISDNFDEPLEDFEDYM
jgi:predicted DNA-binding antitoxin AbrB/MazE fold protein